MPKNARYIASGSDAWSRNLDLLPTVKIETEALDPVELRRIVVEAIDAVLDGAILAAVEAEEEREREAIRTFIADARNGGAAER